MESHILQNSCISVNIYLNWPWPQMKWRRQPHDSTERASVMSIYTRFCWKGANLQTNLLLKCSFSSLFIGWKCTWYDSNNMEVNFDPNWPLWPNQSRLTTVIFQNCTQLNWPCVKDDMMELSGLLQKHCLILICSNLMPAALVFMLIWHLEFPNRVRLRLQFSVRSICPRENLSILS